MGWDTMPCSRKKERTLGLSNLEILVSTNMGIFKWLENKEIKFNPRPFVHKQTHYFHHTKNIEFYADMVKKIDALIQESEQDAVFEVVDAEPSTKATTMGEIAEIRNPLQRRPERSPPSLDAPAPPVFNKLGTETELFDVQLPNTTHTDFKIVASIDDIAAPAFRKHVEESSKTKDFHTWMLGIDEKQGQKVAMNFAKIRVRKKEGAAKKKPTKDAGKTKQKGVSTTTSSGKETGGHKNINGVTKTLQELEKTKKEIEQREKKLQEAKELEKQKERELKVKEIETKKQKKLKERERKKQLKQQQIKERELQKAERLKQKELLKQEKQKKLLAKKALLEQKKREKQKVKVKEIETKKQKQLKTEEPEKKAKFILFKKGDEKEETQEKIKKKMRAKKTRKKAPTLSTSKTHHFLHKKKEITEESPMVDDDLIKVLTIADNLLEKLPNDVVDNFVQTKDFELYERVISKYKIK